MIFHGEKCPSIEDVTKKYNIPVVYNFPRTHPRQQSAGYGEYSSS
jgi:hypothetical protein